MLGQTPKTSPQCTVRLKLAIARISTHSQVSLQDRPELLLGAIMPRPPNRTIQVDRTHVVYKLPILLDDIVGRLCGRDNAIPREIFPNLHPSPKVRMRCLLVDRRTWKIEGRKDGEKQLLLRSIYVVRTVDKK